MRQGIIIDGSEKETHPNRKVYRLADEVIKALKNMKGEKKKRRGDEWIEEQGLILFRGKVYVEG